MDASRQIPKGAGSSRDSTASTPQRHGNASQAAARSLTRPLILALLFLAASTLVSLWVGYRLLDPSLLREDPTARILFFDLRLPRVVLGGILGASLGAVGACLQAFFRNPLAEPFTLGVSGGGTLGASVAIALGWGINLAGVPMVFLAAFAGSAAAVLVVYWLSRTGDVVMPGTLLLAGVVVNLIASAGVILIQYIADYSRALQILRWTIGTIDVVGFDRI
ncbi:MAG: iron chelate uptake ABC transporter family permease subunit, partial [Acidobacteriota bacterium]|nr:iron chelate uptake ABC transporter family permease subunit [Acidobacteriota bacterium]